MRRIKRVLSSGVRVEYVSSSFFRNPFILYLRRLRRFSQEKKEAEAEEATEVEPEPVEDSTMSLKASFEKLKAGFGFKATGVAQSMVSQFLPEEDLRDVLQAFTERYDILEKFQYFFTSFFILASPFSIVTQTLTLLRVPYFQLDRFQVNVVQTIKVLAEAYNKGQANRLNILPPKVR